MTSDRNLLRAALDRDRRVASSFVGRLVRWLSSDACAVGRLRLELERCRFNHAHEMTRLQTLVDDGTLERLHATLARRTSADPDDEPEMV